MKIEIGTCGNFHIIELVTRIRENIGYYVDERRRFSENALLAKASGTGESDSRKDPALGDIIEEREKIRMSAGSAEIGYEGASEELPDVVRLSDIIVLHDALVAAIKKRDEGEEGVARVTPLSPALYDWEPDMIRKGLEQLMMIGWIVGEVQAGNMGVTEVFRIFRNT